MNNSSAMIEIPDPNSTDTSYMETVYPNQSEYKIKINKSQPICKSKKNISPKRFSKRRAASRVSRKSRHRRQQHHK